jgi:hypothetical protein
MKGLLGFLLLVGFLVAYWQWILAAIVVVLILRAAPVAWREWQEERSVLARRRAELIARADQQHRWAMAGDERGVYGLYPPAAYWPVTTPQGRADSVSSRFTRRKVWE